MALIRYLYGEWHVFSEKRTKRRKEMKEYVVKLKQEIVVEGQVVIQADNKTDAKEVINDLIEDSKIQNLITDGDGDFIKDNNLECDEWKITSVEDY